MAHRRGLSRGQTVARAVLPLDGLTQWHQVADLGDLGNVCRARRFIGRGRASRANAA